jgi:phospholipase/carboxylesterase
MTLDTFVHIYEQPKSEGKPVFLLLHGTGGDENDLVSLIQMIDSEAGYLSVRGNINENGMNRFFERKAMGVFDEESLKTETKKLHAFLDAAAEEYGFTRANLIALGYSNGANIAGSLIFHYQDALEAGMLLHPMVPIREVEIPNLEGKNFFIGAGENDPICPPEETEELETLLSQAGAEVTVYWGRAGHSLTQEELTSARGWYEELQQEKG